MAWLGRLILFSGGKGGPRGGVGIVFFWGLLRKIAVPKDAWDKPKTKEEEEAEVRAFWILYAITGAGNQPFRDYYGLPRVAKSAGSA